MAGMDALEGLVILLAEARGMVVGGGGEGPHGVPPKRCLPQARQQPVAGKPRSWRRAAAMAVTFEISRSRTILGIICAEIRLGPAHVQPPSSLL
jgi:hypothetical protein